MKLLKLQLIVFGCLLCFAQAASAYLSPGQASGFVNDFAGVLSIEKKSSLETELTNFKQETGHEIALVSIKSLDGDSIENYANELFRDWGIGRKDVNDGVLFLAAIDDHAMRIEVGYGLEGALTDLESSWIIDGIAPYFKNSDYDGGYQFAATEIEASIRGELDTSTSNTEIEASSENFIPFIFFIIYIFFSVVMRFLGRSKSWWLGGVIGGVIGLILGVVFNFYFLIIILGLFGLLLDFIASKAGIGKGKSGHGPWFWGGGSFGGGSGGGGFGGFGGGFSGGGGSSGRW